MRLQKTSSGHTNLQIWRGGRCYDTQKGAIYRREWNNILFSGSPASAEEENILPFDIRQPLPYPDGVFDAVFLFHIVEHLTPLEAESLLGEIHRLLKPSGIVRLSTPNLEDICRAYLSRLEEYDQSPTVNNLIKYEWSVLELLDQIARVRTGGLMTEYIQNQHYDPDYAKARFGVVFDDLAPHSGPVKKLKRSDGGMRRLSPKRIWGGVGRRIRRILDKRLLGFDLDEFEYFRRCGEVNKWLYDYFSLTMLLRKTGFSALSQKTYCTSDIPDWDRFDFERSSYADHPIEPSLYVEGHKTS